MKSLLKAVCLAVCCGLASCSRLPVYRFTGGGLVTQEGHTIELSPICLARTDVDKWYVASGPPANPAECLRFRIGVRSPQPWPAGFEVVRVEALWNKRAPLTLQRLSKEKEKRESIETAPRELWVLAQPSPTAAPPDMPVGKYQIKIHYRLEGREYDAEWECAYEVGFEIVRWSMGH